MHHLVPTFCLLAMSFWLLARKNGLTKTYYGHCWLPLALLLLAFGVEQSLGHGRMEHALYHFAYDTSYILTLVGLLLLIYVVFQRRRAAEFASAVLLAVVPLLQLLFF